MPAEQIDNPQRLAILTAQVRELRAELSQAHRIRDTLGLFLRKLWKSSHWRVTRPLWLIQRMLGRLDLGLNDLIPITDIRQLPDGTWQGSSLPHFLIPTVPLDGWVRIRARIKSSCTSRACLYFDTGEAFHQQDHLELSRIAGFTDVERVIFLRQPTHLFRFDPIQTAAEFTVESFSIKPTSTVWLHCEVILRNLLMVVTDRGSHRPSLLLGLKLLLMGEWTKFHRQLIANFESITSGTQYDVWRKQHEITDDSRVSMRGQIAGWADPPTISIILPVYDVPEIYLRKCIDSVLRQIYPNWELCIADDGSTKPHIRKVLAEYAAADLRIKVMHLPGNLGISGASNAALEMAWGQYIALLDHDDELAEHALFKVAEALVRDPRIDMIYSDEDKLSPTGRHVDPFFKPDWSPEYFMACMYTCHLGVYRANLIRSIGGWHSEFDGAQDYDLALRVVSRSEKILHIPDVLYHWRVLPTSTASNASAKPFAHGRAGRALENHLLRQGRSGWVENGPSAGFHRVRYSIRGDPLVSIVIPSACRAGRLHGRDTWFLLECVSSIRRRSSYSNIEIIVLDNDDMPGELAAAMKPFNVRLISFTEPFNLARKMNLGAFSAAGEQLLILNDDIEVISRDWIQSMLEYSQWPEIGAVGAQLLFPNGTQQHNGVTILDGNPGHPFYQYPGEHEGYFLSSQVHRNWSAVTGACMMTRADVFKSVGGFSDKFPVNYNDVDYCLKVLKSGGRIVHMPYARLYHHESVSVKRTGEHELETFKQTWLKELPQDSYYNPNLCMNACDFRIG